MKENRSNHKQYIYSDDTSEQGLTQKENMKKVKENKIL